MKDFPNLEASTFRKGEYVGYCNGVWRIRRRLGGGWIVVQQHGADSFHAKTLEAVSKRLLDKVLAA